MLYVVENVPLSPGYCRVSSENCIKRDLYKYLVNVIILVHNIGGRRSRVLW